MTRLRRLKEWFATPSQDPPWWIAHVFAYVLAISAIVGILLHRPAIGSLILLAVAMPVYRLGLREYERQKGPR